MKAILMSIRPQYVAKILNKEKTIEVRKKFPKDYVGWVYIYCTKDSKSDETLCYDGFSGILGFRPNYKVGIADSVLNGKVIARFWCDKVGEIYFGASALESKRTVDWICNDIFSFEKEACLTQEDLDKYLGNVKHSPQGYAIHITKLEIFDKPMCLNAFYYAREPRKDLGLPKNWKQIVTRPPQSWCYIEV